jgi:hypothetical protein
MKLFHRTTEAIGALILRDGFLDQEDRYTSDCDARGVWFSDRPQDSAERENGEAVISVDLGVSKKSLSAFEWRDGQKSYREWLIPVPIVNRNLTGIHLCRTAACCSG